MKSKRVLVTGGAGFIGSHAVDAYLSRGCRVTVVDNLRTGSRRNVHPKADFFKADICDLPALERIFAKTKPDIINHHAAHIDVAASFRDPLATFKTNVTGTVHVLLCAGQAKVSKFVFASSGGAVYGEPKKIPTPEDAPAEPLSPYGLSKLVGEECVKFYARMFGFSYVILRYANVYGPRQRSRGETGVVAVFKNLMERGERPRIYGNGEKTRDYVNVSDVARANVLAIARGRDVALNIGTGRETRDLEVFRAVADATGYRHEPKFAPVRPGEVIRSALDSRRAFKTIGWRPNVSFSQGIPRMFHPAP